MTRAGHAPFAGPESGFIDASQERRQPLSIPANAMRISNYEHSFAIAYFAVALTVSSS
jgi:hypothetical protein